MTVLIGRFTVVVVRGKMVLMHFWRSPVKEEEGRRRN